MVCVDAVLYSQVTTPPVYKEPDAGVIRILLSASTVVDPSFPDMVPNPKSKVVVKVEPPEPNVAVPVSSHTPAVKLKEAMSPN
jgi:hypothetical protein